MIAPILSDDSALRFPSLASLRAAHGDLLRRQRESAEAPIFLAEIEMFLRRGRSTGALLDETEQRWEAQSILDYWVTFLFRTDRRTVDATLDDFDPKLAPRLDDSDCPYVGLDAFRESRFEVFFGRKRMIDAMVERLATERFLAVMGDSGSGKSSVVLAGLLPVLKAGGLPGSGSWRYLSPLVPGPEPLAHLARAFSSGKSADTVASQAAWLREEPRRVLELAGGDGRPCILVVDQFEEVFTLCEDETVREAFVASLAALVESPGLRHTVLLTMRSEYQDNVAKLERFQPLFETARVWVTPLSSPELRDAIVRPADLRGLKFEEGVVDALLRDILGEPAGLPLLQFTLLKLWENRERNWVTWEAYRELGGGRLALRRSADAFYDALIPQEQITTRRILLRMVRTSERLEVTSSRVQRRDLYRGGEAAGWIDRMLDKLVAAHLVRFTPGEIREEDQFEVAHEALVRNWPKLVEWLDQERTEITTRRRLESKVEEWLRLKKKGGLLDEIQLLEAERWLRTGSATVLGFHSELPALVAASREAIEETKRKQEEVRQRELEQVKQLAEAERRRAELKARSNLIFRLLTVILTALFLLSVLAGLRARTARQEANYQENLAKTAATEASKKAQEAEVARQQALREQQLATKAQRQAEAERRRALEEKLRADVARQQALEEKLHADTARKQAEMAQLATEAEREVADQLRKDAEDSERKARQALMEKETALKRAEEALVEVSNERQRAEAALEQYKEQKLFADKAQALTTEAYSKNPKLRQDSNFVLREPQQLKLNKKTRPLVIGASIGAQEVTGSLCCAVIDRAGVRYLLSLGHVFTGKPGTPIMQPSPLDGGILDTDKVAVVVRASQDQLKGGTIAKLEPGVAIAFSIPEIGMMKGIETTVYPGDRIRLVGRSSGIVAGRVLAVNDREVITTIVPRPGDGGAAVLSDDGDLVGLLWGSNQEQSIVIRVGPILRDLDVKLSTTNR
ncbi:MAG TPA: hypothetical protein VF756_06635 [Thermoanaerobaculia bacterium]